MKTEAEIVEQIERIDVKLAVVEKDVDATISKLKAEVPVSLKEAYPILKLFYRLKGQREALVWMLTGSEMP